MLPEAFFWTTDDLSPIGGDNGLDIIDVFWPWRIRTPRRRWPSLCTTFSNIRTFADWNDVVLGFLEGDLVAHCGENIQGKYLHTLTLTDIATGWTELRALLGKTEADVLQEVDQIKELLPFPLLGLDTDNGGEFLNYGLIDWCERNKITFTRSREYWKNDQAHVEEKNGSLVRKLVGYDRYEGIESWQMLTEF